MEEDETKTGAKSQKRSEVKGERNEWMHVNACVCERLIPALFVCICSRGRSVLVCACYSVESLL